MEAIRDDARFGAATRILAAPATSGPRTAASGLFIVATALLTVWAVTVLCLAVPAA
jgi:hypothetical protein